MSLKAPFLSFNNFDLAFRRIVRGENIDYKTNYRHLLPTFNLAIKHNIDDIINDLKTGAYRPGPPSIIYAPKASGVLRPLKLLSLRDLIVYQAIVNIVALRFAAEQDKHKFKRSFGAIAAGRQSPFFYLSWKRCYRQFSARVEKAFRAKNVYVADFDLVSFFDLIDHTRLRACLERRVKDQDLLDLLFRCLGVWTVESDDHLGHGVPQGPEPSAFLAECLLFTFDAMNFRGVEYIRYVDDIKLMARNEAAARRALVRLDLASRKLGLVPQAQKVALRKIKTLKEIRKGLPSGVVSAVTRSPSRVRTQNALLKIVFDSLSRSNGKTVIDDITSFRFALLRLNPRKAVLRRMRPLFNSRPDCSWVLSRYAMKFPKQREAADILLQALRSDPTYDQSAAHYIEAMDVCEPPTGYGPYRRVIRTVIKRSEERSIRLPIACIVFLGKRYGVKAALKRIESQNSSKVRTALVNSLFGRPGAPFNLSDCSAFLQKEACGSDADAARYSATLLLRTWPWTGKPTMLSMRTVNRSVQLLLVGLGLRKRGPHRATVLDVFFGEQYKIFLSILWKRALKKDWREVERRCIELQKLSVGNPSARLLMLDTFNEILIQNFSASHSALQAAYRAAAQPLAHPDWGKWLYQPFLLTVLPIAGPWFREVHRARVENELAHAKVKKGKLGGKPTKPTNFREMEKLMSPAQRSWAEMIKVWRTIL